MASTVDTLNFERVKKTIVVANTPEQIMSTSTFTTEVEIYFDASNSAAMYFGNSTIEATTGIPRQPGARLSYAAEDICGEAKHFDLSKLYVYGAVGDYVRVQYRVKA